MGGPQTGVDLANLVLLAVSAIMLICSLAIFGYANGIADQALAQAKAEVAEAEAGVHG